MAIHNIKNVILVLSGKGGVGKSTFACQLALSLQKSHLKIGLLDIDICGPSIPKMMNLYDQVVCQGENGWVPIEYIKEGEIPLKVMSIGFLLENKDSAVIWRGPRKNAMINQFLIDVDWGDLDCLVIDTPPGTSDEHISIAECLKANQNHITAILITTPQQVAVGAVRREITFCQKVGIEIFGLVENMSGFKCQHCSHYSKVFATGGGKSLAEHAQIEFLFHYQSNQIYLNVPIMESILLKNIQILKQAKQWKH
ncbi:Cytosolic Fe-S cluster assembly factor NUBP2 -like protein [Sarcoptes scabiei]|uniref:Cytosolic Fe-S cluster assembly factor NUBP2 -like protein n=1 Tax=Sarcoptes scabiei TaxID=52283 RepID=A0A834R435_SARSC|nr:Cytosolic Fe-S cluster assembly factor NUBP2 -like protein [Sarcoptes scabiei]